jgi:hypothetical protein
LVIHESIYREISNHLLSSEFQTREFEIMIDSISHKHDATQMIVNDNNGSDVLTIPLNLAEFMINFRHRLPTTDEITGPKHYFLT